MSVTVTAVPAAFLAAKILTASISVITATAISAATVAADNINTTMKNAELDELLEKYKTIENNNNQHKITQDDIKILSQEYQTQFMDSELVTRTLEEYGINIINNEENCIIGEIERVKITFIRENNSLPYKMQMKFPDDCENMQEEIANNLYEEYGSNSQEETYIKIKEKIENTNMYIEEEEILDDDSIVLTININ